VEFSTRTVAHLMLGASIGLLLIVKLSIIAFLQTLFRRRPVSGPRPVVVHDDGREPVGALRL
jgi:hypothetical protein